MCLSSQWDGSPPPAKIAYVEIYIHVYVHVTTLAGSQIRSWMHILYIHMYVCKLSVGQLHDSPCCSQVSCMNRQSVSQLDCFPN